MTLNDPRLPHWLADQHIQHGYRNTSGWGRAFLSLFSFHNETINVYTHGLGAVFFLVVGVALVLGSGWAHNSSLFTLSSLATPGQDYVLAATLRHFSDGAVLLERAAASVGRFALGPAASPLSRRALDAHPPLNDAETPLVVDGRHTAGMLPWLPAPRPRCPWGARQRGVAGSARSAISGLVDGVSERLEAARGQLRRIAELASREGKAAADAVLSAAASADGAVSRVSHDLADAGASLGRAAAEYYAELSSVTRTVAQAGGSWGREHSHDGVPGPWEPRRALAQLAAAAERLEGRLQGSFDAALEAAARDLGVEAQWERLSGGAAQAAGGNAAAHGAAGGGGGGGVVRAMGEEQPGVIPAHQARRWPALVFVASALLCLGCSMTFHLFWVVSERTYRLLARLDYVGIAVLIAGSTCPIIEYVLACDRSAVMFASLGMYGLCSLAVVMGLMERFSSEKWRVVRVSVFIGTGLGGIFPILWVTITMGHDPVVWQAVLQIATMGAMYVLGAVLYGTRIPERWIPGRLDFVGASHQIFHALVFMAAFLHYHTVLLLFRWRDMQPECPAPTV
ncbi:hypothetical protein FNF27_07499 [Cafeteria roenbergensis]|uniref:Uncharacterized protein n=1 Tax=Cafeteria roenbergensis TaxID=33653 RepID=A0A5A8DP84_CAFRO|nr:hypothetical protein FNF27_07499 [Cafeteria roenbergensis]